MNISDYIYICYSINSHINHIRNNIIYYPQPNKSMSWQSSQAQQQQQQQQPRTQQGQSYPQQPTKLP